MKQPFWWTFKSGLLVLQLNIFKTQAFVCSITFWFAFRVPPWHGSYAYTYNQKNLVILKNNLSAVPMSKILNNTSETNEKTAMMMSTQNITTILNLMHHRTCEHHLQILLQQQMIRDVMCTKMPPTVVCLLITEIAITLLMRLLKESPSQAC